MCLFPPRIRRGAGRPQCLQSAPSPRGGREEPQAWNGQQGFEPVAAGGRAEKKGMLLRAGKDPFKQARHYPELFCSLSSRKVESLHAFKSPGAESSGYEKRRGRHGLIYL